MDALFWTGCIVGLLIFLVLRYIKTSGQNRAPGPYGLPIVGYMPFLSTQLHLDLSRLSKKYGKIFGFQMGSQYTVAISDFEASKEAFNKDAFQGRPQVFPIDFSKEFYETGAFFDLPFRDQRRFALHMLRDLGFGKSKMEGLIQEEISGLMEHIEKDAGKPFLVGKLLAPSMSNNIGALVFGKRFKYDDPIRKMLNDAVVSTTSYQVGWIDFFPTLKKILKFVGLFHLEKKFKMQGKLSEYFKKEIEEHEKTLNPNNIRDFIDGYLLEISKRKDNPAFCKNVLQDLAFIFFVAGSETVKTSVEWLLLLAASMPDAQKRIQFEIDDVLGGNRMPEWPDHTAMSYTEAFIMEFTRWRTITPISVLKRTLTNTEVGDYFVPKNTLVISNLWEMHRDTEYWGPDAGEFRPERFLNEDGKSIKKWDRYIPFSTGKRSCPGEPLAKIEVFLYFTSILQKFNLRLPDGKKADFEGVLAAALQVKPQEIIFTRKQ